jgi:hypothetical protein
MILHEGNGSFFCVIGDLVVDATRVDAAAVRLESRNRIDSLDSGSGLDSTCQR